jgi:hypothetical protein
VAFDTDCNTFWLLFTGLPPPLLDGSDVVEAVEVVVVLVVVDGVVGLGVVMGTLLSSSTFSVTRIGFLTLFC